MNTATISTLRRPGATSKHSPFDVIDALDALDQADQLVLAIQLMSDPSPEWKAIGAVATAVRRQHDLIRSLLNGARP